MDGKSSPTDFFPDSFYGLNGWRQKSTYVICKNKILYGGITSISYLTEEWNRNGFRSISQPSEIRYEVKLQVSLIVVGLVNSLVYVWLFRNGSPTVRPGLSAPEEEEWWMRNRTQMEIVKISYWPKCYDTYLNQNKDKKKSHYIEVWIYFNWEERYFNPTLIQWNMNSEHSTQKRKRNHFTSCLFFN